MAEFSALSERIAMHLSTSFVWSLMLVAAVVASGLGEEFRIESKVYLNDEPEPVSTSTTLFHEDTVYDFLSSPTQIAVFSKRAESPTGRFILLHPEREERAELNTEQILKFALHLQAWAASQDEPLMLFSANPQFRQDFDAEQGVLTLSSDLVNYRLLTTPAKNKQVMQQYRDFTDWYTRMGAMLHPGGLPPFSRLAVNAALSQYDVLPSEVYLNIPAQKKFPKTNLAIRSEHRVSMRLSKQDRELIDQANGYLVKFKVVSLEQFRRE